MEFEIIDRPARNTRRIRNNLSYDLEVERALLDTLRHGRAVKLSLGLFHSSPAKGRLWLKGYSVRHRVLEDRENVAAWIEEDILPKEEIYPEEMGQLALL